MQELKQRKSYHDMVVPGMAESVLVELCHLKTYKFERHTYATYDETDIYITSNHDEYIGNMRRTSGAMYSGVPQRVRHADARTSFLEKPQSHSLRAGCCPGSECSRMLSSCSRRNG